MQSLFSRSSATLNDTGNLTGSQETLVSKEQLQFRLTNDNPVNTNIRGPNGLILYKAHTTFDNGTVTTVTKPNRQGQGQGQEYQDTVVAALHWNDMLPDKIAVGTEKPVRMGKLLSAGPLWSQTVTMNDDSGQRYQWKGYESKGRLRLYAVDEPDTPLIAAFQKSRADAETGQATPAYLWISARGQEILDLAIWSFLFLEKNKRTLENGFANRNGSTTF